MSTPAKLGGFAAILAVVLAVSFGIGRAVGPVGGTADTSHHTSTKDRRTAEVDDYTVTLRGDLTVARASELTFEVQRDGRPVTDLVPYIDSDGRLVIVGTGEPTFIPVHAERSRGNPAEVGPDLVFHTTVPSAGTYRLQLNFQHDGATHHAEFVLRSTTDATPNPTNPTDHGTHGG